MTAIDPLSGTVCPFIIPLSSDPAMLQAGDQLQQLWRMQNSSNQKANEIIGVVNNLVLQNDTSHIDTEVICVATATTTGVEYQTRTLTVAARTALSAAVKLGKTLFPVVVVADGGSQGSDSTQCSRTYTVYDLTGVTNVKTTLTGITNATKYSPVWNVRPILGKMLDATQGFAYYDDTNALVLYCVDELTNGPAVKVLDTASGQTIASGSTTTDWAATAFSPDVTHNFLITVTVLFFTSHLATAGLPNLQTHLYDSTSSANVMTLQTITIDTTTITQYFTLTKRLKLALDATHSYKIRFDFSGATYSGGVPGFAATNATITLELCD